MAGNTVEFNLAQPVEVGPNLMNLEGLVLPQVVGGDLNLGNLVNIEEDVLPQVIGENDTPTEGGN